MIEQKKLKQVRELIEYGFDVRVISFELDIPVEEVLKYKENLDCKEKILPDDYQRVKSMRRKYNKLFFNTRVEEKVEPKVINLSEKSNLLVEKIITYIEKKCEEIKNHIDTTQRRLIAGDMLSKLRIIRGCPLSIEQSEKIYNLMNIEHLKGLRFYSNDNMDDEIENIKKECISCMIKEISAKIDEVVDIDELRTLEKKITLDMKRKYQMLLGNVENRISQKRLKIQEKQAIDRINNISNDIRNIVKDLADDNLEIENAENIINQEAKKKTENSSKGKFSMTEEQQRKMIFMQIRKALVDKAQEFPIKNPQNAMLQLYQLDGKNLEGAIHTVVENLINRKEFDSATNLCNQFLPKGNDMRIMQYARDLKIKIRNAKISDFALAGIRMRLPFEEEDRFIQLLEYGIEKENIKLEDISLGRNQDGSKRITLADVWPDEKIR